MTRDEVVDILRTRLKLDAGTFGEHHVDAWHEVLRPHDHGRIRSRLVTLVRAGHGNVSLGDLTANIKPPEPDTPRERYTHNANGEPYLPWSDPRAQAAFRRGYRQATGREWDGDDPTGAAA